ncbi:MAG: ABC transporter ATP-binding protein [Microlunatus sp.]
MLRDVTITFKPGHIYGIVGPNGSGKSVLFRLLCGFTLPTSGEVKIHPDYRPKGIEFPHNFGVIIDGPGYVGHWSGIKNLLNLARIRRLVDDAAVRDTMTRLGLNPDSKTPVARYSMGMKQKLAIAQATMENQQVLVLDEPFNALDATSAEILTTILREHRAKGGTVIFASHRAEDIVQLADHTYRINDGRLEHTGTRDISISTPS